MATPPTPIQYSPAVEQECKGINASIRAHDGHITRITGRLEMNTRLMDSDGSSRLSRILEVDLEKLSEQIDMCEMLYNKKITLKPCRLIDCNKKAGEQSDILNHWQTDVVMCIAKYEKKCRFQQPTPAAATARPASRAKPLEGLKPKPLSREHTPAEFALWKEGFTAFYTASELERAGIEEQRAYLAQCLDTDMNLRVRGKVDPKTAIYGENGVLDIIESEFMKLYPLFSRRHKFFSYTQQKGESATNFKNHLKMLGREADLTKVTVDMVHMMKYICGLTDEKLRTKLMELSEPTLIKMEDEIERYDAAKAATAAIRGSNDGGQANKTSTGPAKAPKPAKAANSDGAGKKCACCGRTGHETSTCRMKSATCYACGIQGHMATMCKASQEKKDKYKASKASGEETSCQTKETEPEAEETEGGNARTARTLDVSHKFSKPTPLRIFKFKNMAGKRFDHEVVCDTGTTKSVIAEDILLDLDLDFSKKRMPEMKAANGVVMNTPGTVELYMLRDDEKVVKVYFTVCSDLSAEILVSWHDLINLGVIDANFPATLPARSRRTKTDAWTALKVGKLVREKFANVLSNTLKKEPMKGDPMKIHLMKTKDGENIVPRQVYTARQIPLHQREEADKVTNELIKAGIIVPISKPTPWVSPAFYVPKPDGRMRMVTDFTYINTFIKRPTHPFPSSKEIMRRLKPDSTCFMALDCVHGYFQMALDEESSYLTTFLLPRGRFRYLRGPMGLNPTSDEWCRRSDAIIEGLDYAEKIVDDIFVQAPDYETLWKHAAVILSRCEKLNVTISLKKMQIGEEITFAGYRVGKDGVKPDPDMTRSIGQFPTPKTVTDVRSFLGLANQLAGFLPDLAHGTVAIRALMKKGIEFRWMEAQEKEFKKMKDILTGNLITKPFNPLLKTELLTDASKLHGLGYALIQKEDDGNPRLIMCGSCGLTDAQKRYAVIEIECLAVQWATQKCDYYLKGIDTFNIVTDHKPLLGVFAKDLGAVENPRLQRLRMKISGYNFTLEWKAGKTNLVADALSRYPVFGPEAGDEDLREAGKAVCKRIEEATPCAEVMEAASSDEEYGMIIEAVQRNARIDTLPEGHPAKALKPHWGKISLYGAPGEELVVIDSTRIVLPRAARPQVLKLLHLGHCGAQKMKKQASELYWWQGMNNDIEQISSSCTPCKEMRPSQQKEPMVDASEPMAPMSHIGLDLFSFKGEEWLIMVCRYSGWPFAAKLETTSTAAVVDDMVTWFNMFGWPSVARHDGGPQFRDIFSLFCSKHGIRNELSSAYMPQSNGLAESCVKAVKRILEKTKGGGDEFEQHLAAYRNTPREDGYSPAQLMFARRLKGPLPMLPAHTLVKEEIQARGREARLKVQLGNKETHDKRAKALSVLEVTDRVVVQQVDTKRWDRMARIKEVRESGHSYVLIDEETGREFLRNRKFLRPEEELDIPDKEGQDEEVPDASPMPEEKKKKKKKKVDAEEVKAPIRRSGRNLNKLEANRTSVREQLNSSDKFITAPVPPPLQNSTWAQHTQNRSRSRQSSPAFIRRCTTILTAARKTRKGASTSWRSTPPRCSVQWAPQSSSWPQPRSCFVSGSTSGPECSAQGNKSALGPSRCTTWRQGGATSGTQRLRTNGSGTKGASTRPHPTLPHRVDGPQGQQREQGGHQRHPHGKQPRRPSHTSRMDECSPWRPWRPQSGPRTSAASSRRTRRKPLPAWRSSSAIRWSGTNEETTGQPDSTMGSRRGSRHSVKDVKAEREQIFTVRRQKTEDNKVLDIKKIKCKLWCSRSQKSVLVHKGITFKEEKFFFGVTI